MVVMVRKSEERIWKEKLGTLEEVLEEFNDESVKFTVKYDALVDSDYILKTVKKRVFSDKLIIAWLRHEQSLVVKATNKKYLPFLTEICEAYEKKTLKDEPIIEY